MSDPNLPIALGLFPRSARVLPNGHLEVGGCDLVELADRFGTPLYVYDEGELRARCREYAAAFGAPAVAYAGKAFLGLAMAQLVADEGLCLDVATGGELDVARRADFPMDRIVMHGNNKSDDELATALQLGVGRIIVDSGDELDRLERLVAHATAATRLLVRATPGVEAHTHEYISTGDEDSKFGIAIADGAALAAVRRVVNSAYAFGGVHCHIGSQIAEMRAFDEAAHRLAEFVATIQRDLGVAVPEVSLGGGLGVPYVAGDVFPSIAEYAERVLGAWERAARDAGVTVGVVTVEPGRSIAAPAGIACYRVGTVKTTPGGRTYVAVDGGMSDNLRPSMYDAEYEVFLPAHVELARDLTVAVVGKHCESGDLLARNAHVPSALAVGDLLAMPTAGAYHLSMASNYNRVTRPAVVFTHDGVAREVVRRETLDDLVARESL